MGFYFCPKCTQKHNTNIIYIRQKIKHITCGAGSKETKFDAEFKYISVHKCDLFYNAKPTVRQQSNHSALTFLEALLPFFPLVHKYTQLYGPTESSLKVKVLCKIVKKPI